MYYSIKNRDNLSLGSGVFGGSQKWYSDEWRRRSGCGPTSASNIFWYLSRANAALSALCDINGEPRERFSALMERMFEFVTPGAGGVNTSKIFIDGARGYAQSRGFDIDARSLEVAGKCKPRPSEAEMAEFLSHALERDTPIAFLNLSNGDVEALESWHWVTILALETDTLTATISDQGAIFDIDLSLWLKTTALGGAFVFIEIMQ